MIVSDYTALLSGLSVNGAEIMGRPTYVTYSFAQTAPDYLKVTNSSDFVASYTPFSEASRAIARDAMQQWANASGLIAVEVDGVGDINFSYANLGSAGDLIGLASLPQFAFTGTESDVFIDLSVTDPGELNFTLLHEIGHALGLKHPFDGETTLAEQLDSTASTVMSYTFVPGTPLDRLAPFDLQAIEALYGPQSADGAVPAGSTFDPANRSSVQIGTDGADTLHAVGGWTNRIEGGAGDDTLSAGFSAGIALGGDGQDLLYGGGTAILDGGAGDDGFGVMPGGVTVSGGDGDDYAVVLVMADPLPGPLVRYDGGDGVDGLEFVSYLVPEDDAPFVFSLADALAAGTTIANVEFVYISLEDPVRGVITGSDGQEDIAGGALEDVLSGLGGDDVIDGGGGNDQIDGGDGDDQLFGRGGGDALVGGRGNDTLNGGVGNDLLDGGAGSDVAVFSGNKADYRIVREGLGYRISDTRGSGNEGSDTLLRIETLLFADGETTLAIVPGTDTQFSYVAPDGFAGSVGGNGTVLGSNGAQVITLLDRPSSLAFDGSFSRGGDAVYLPGTAGSFNIALAGSSAVLSDGDTTVAIPIGTTGLAVVFYDGARTLKFDVTAGAAVIGTQQVLDTAAAITAAAEGGTPAVGTDPAAQGRVIFTAEGSAAIIGNLSVFGTNQPELLTTFAGNQVLDASFARGGDTIEFDGRGSDFAAYRAGSSVTLVSDSGSVTIPVGLVGAALVFDDGERTLRFDAAANAIKIGDQAITSTSAGDAQDLASIGPSATLQSLAADLQAITLG